MRGSIAKLISPEPGPASIKIVKAPGSQGYVMAINERRQARKYWKRLWNAIPPKKRRLELFHPREPRNDRLLETRDKRFSKEAARVNISEAQDAAIRALAATGE